MEQKGTKLPKIIWAKDLMKEYGFSRNKSYEIIKKIKKRYRLEYKNAFVSEEIFKAYINGNFEVKGKV
ncbi:MAG: hypothetical protein RMJ97_07180 [Raineya sp.]|nr:hypothetical protein [Raineya sp.]